MTSHIDGTPDLYFPPLEKTKRKIKSNLVSISFILIDIMSVYALFSLKIVMAGEELFFRDFNAGCLLVGH